MYETKREKIYQKLHDSFAEERVLEIQRLMAYYKCALMEIETKFKVLDEEFSLQHDRNPINSIKTRLKKFPSIIEKLERKMLPVSVESIEKNLKDVAGIRVVCAFGRCIRSGSGIVKTG